MNCYLSWNLKDMTNISAEKLQRNLAQQVAYLDLYRSELTKEAYRFNIASILKYASVHKASFGNDALSKKATECLIVFLHAVALRQQAFFTPSDSENSVHSKGCRNLHRLMLENVKATMRYIDYSVLLKRAHGEIDINQMFSLREELYNKVFPEETIVDVCSKESINDSFFSIVDHENSADESFAGYDVQNICHLDSSVCELLSAKCCSLEDFGESEYGILGSIMGSLETPFLKHSGNYYSFVTRFSLNKIHEKLSSVFPEEEEEEFEEEKPEEEKSEEVLVEPEESYEPYVDDEPEEPAEPEVCDDESQGLAETDPEEYNSFAPYEESEVAPEVEDEEIDGEPNEVEAEEELEEEPEEESSDDEIPWDEDAEEPSEEETEPEEDNIYEDAIEDEDDIDPFEFFEEEELEEAPEEVKEEEEEDEDPYNGSLFDDIDSEPEPEEEAHIVEESVSEEGPAVDEADQEKEAHIVEESSLEEEPAVDESISEQEESVVDEPAQVEEEPTPESEPEPELTPEVEPEPQPVEEPVPEEEPAPEPQPVPEPVPEPEEESAPTPEPVPAPEPQPVPESAPAQEPAPTPEPVSTPVPEEPLLLLDTITKSFTKENSLTTFASQHNHEQRKEISNYIDSAWQACIKDGHDKMFTIPESTISVIIFKASRDPMLQMQRRQNVGALMYLNQKDSWDALELPINENGALLEPTFTTITKRSFTDWQWRIVENIGMRMLERRKK